MNEYFIGIDLGGTNVVVCLVDRDGHIAMRHVQPAQIELGPVSLVERLVSIYGDMIVRAKVSAESVLAMGIGSPGPLSIVGGRIIKAGNLPGFDNFAIRAELSQKLQLPAVLDNDANVACWGEFWLGAGKGTTDMALFTLGTGVGGGLVCNGELLHGSAENGAELGHMIIQPGGRRCSCGQLGCLEAYASATNTVNRALEAIEHGHKSTMADTRRDHGSLSCKDVFEHAGKGDETALAVVDETARALAQACVNLRHITEPERIVLAGGMINAGEFLFERVRRFYHEMMWTAKPEPMDICPAQLGEDAGVIGAAGLARYCYQHGTLAAVGT